MSADIPPFGLPTTIVESVQLMSAHAGVFAARTIDAPEKVDPDTAGNDICNLIDDMTAFGRHDVLPDRFDDKFTLEVVTGGSVKPERDYPQQLGLIVARAGFDAAVGSWGRVPPKDSERTVIQSTAGAVAFHYAILTGFDSGESGKARHFVETRIKENFANKNLDAPLLKLIREVASECTSVVSVPEASANQGLFRTALRAGLESAHMVIMDRPDLALNAPNASTGPVPK